MNTADTYDMDDAVAALDALHAAMTDDLEALEAQMRVAGEPITCLPGEQTSPATENHEARTALHSGLASIAEVLAWIRFKTEMDPEGDVAVAIQPLPTLRGSLIH
jgi:hypothetical protein